MGFRQTLGMGWYYPGDHAHYTQKHTGYDDGWLKAHAPSFSHRLCQDRLVDNEENHMLE